ncbi:MAG: hypothetical protein RLZZ70_60 [Candidatus Parcubacteria bacterium]|jgi:hypothetical protein
MVLPPHSFGTLTITTSGDKYEVPLGSVILEGEYRMEESWMTDTRGQNGAHISLQLSWHIANQNLPLRVQKYFWGAGEQISEVSGGLVLQTGLPHETKNQYDLLDTLPYFPSFEDLSSYTANASVCDQSTVYGFDLAYKDDITISQIHIQKDSETTFSVLITGTLSDEGIFVDFKVSLARVPCSYIFTIHGYADQYQGVSREERVTDIMNCFAYHYDIRAFTATVLPAIADRDIAQVQFIKCSIITE